MARHSSFTVIRSVVTLLSLVGSKLTTGSVTRFARGGTFVQTAKAAG